MGSGKSAVGRHLARLLRFCFHDSDADIEARTGVDIAFIFEKEGEAGFRLRERESIERLTRLSGVVIATGGGAVIDAENRRMLAERGAVVYLETSVGQQLERTRHGRHRPLLNDTDPEEKLGRADAPPCAALCGNRRYHGVDRRPARPGGGRGDSSAASAGAGSASFV